MAFPPRNPFVWACSRCSWRSSEMKSDVLLPKPDACPKCGAEVVSTPTSQSWWGNWKLRR